MWMTPPPPILTPAPAAPVAERRVLAMGTELRVWLEGPGGELGAERAVAAVRRLEATCSTWDGGSAWSRVNSAQGQATPLDRESLELLAEARAWAQRTEGAFDPILASLVGAWGLRRGGGTPSAAVLAGARQAAGWRLLEVDLAAGTARLAHPGAGIEEGGFLKGHALDAAREASGAASGWVDLGGQVLAWGAALPVAIADPLDRRAARLELRLQFASLACSGTSERGRHILDPATGLPCEAWGCTAVVARRGLEADILSTALYVMGPARGLAWAERHRVAAAFLLNDGSLRMTRGFRALNPTLIPRESR